MNTLSVLRYCRDVLTERQQRDAWQSWFWKIRGKVLDYWIARLEHDAGTGMDVAELSATDQQEIRRSHPLLVPRTADITPAFEMHRDWQAELQNRVQRYLDAVKAHR